jgi:hypothetical protein
MQVLGQEDSRSVDPPSLVIAGTVPLTLQGRKAGIPVDVRYLAAKVWVGHNQEAPSLPIATRRRLLGQLDAFEQHLTRNGTVEIQATANSPGCAKNMVDRCPVPS